MVLILVATWSYIKLVEKKAFSAGFNLSFRGLPRAIFWAGVFFVLVYVAEEIYQRLVLTTLLHREATASSTGHEVEVRALAARVFEYSYIVFEGVVEVFVFIGFLLDRLQKRWGWTASILVSNIVFALWHFPYWKLGLLPGSLLIALTFIAGCIISLNYRVTRNTLSASLCHIFVDSPSAIRVLLGR